MSDTFSIEAQYKVHFHTKNPVPIPVIIESLQGYEKILKRTGPFVELKFPTIEVVDINVLVAHIESGSLIEDFIVRYVFKNRENYDDAKDIAHQLLEDNGVLKTIATLGVGAIIGVGVTQYFGSDEASTKLEAYNNTIINIGGEIDLEADDIRTVISGVSRGSRISKAAVQALSPAKTDEDAEMSVSGETILQVGKDFLSRVPAEYEKPAPYETSETYSGVYIEVRASDVDNSQSGWGGTIQGLSDSRIKFSVADGVDPNQLHGKQRVKVDLVLLSRTENKKLKPHLATITAVHLE